MQHITILVPNGLSNNLSSIVGAYKILLRANDYWVGMGKKSICTVQLAGVSEEVIYYEGIFSVRPHTHVAAITTTDLIIIPSLNHNYQQAILDNQVLVDWIAQQYKQGAEVASICTGAFLLASAGLLNGHKCSTHWAAANSFKTMFPKVNLQTDHLITYENGIYTNGGAYSFLNLIVYLIEKYYNRETAVFCAKVFQVEIDRSSQSTFMIFTGQKQHADEVVQRAQTYIESNVHEKVSVADLSAMVAVGRRNFDRRFIKATGNTPAEYIQRVKIEAAKKALEVTRKTINEVMYDVGYTDVKAFRMLFRKITGISPLDYRKKYHKLGTSFEY